MICHDYRAKGNLNYTHAYIDPNVSCAACHPMDDWPHEGFPPTAGGFNLSNDLNDSGTKAAHMAFVLDSKNCTFMVGTNEAYIACHTRIGVNITWTKSERMNFTAIKDETGNWTIPGFTAEGTNITHVNSSNEWTNP